MIIEHIFYSAALAILAGMVFFHYTGRDPSWIIILFALVPDLDYVTRHHGTFHTVVFMVISSIAVAFLFRLIGLKFLDSLLFSLLGFGAHLVEDALVYDPGWKIFRPFSSQEVGFGLLPRIITGERYTDDFFSLANSEVLIIGVLLLLAAILIRTYVERSSAWIRWYMPDSLYRKFF
jgi:LexA-binding, inner membrane-associated putative hydrolase